MNDLSFKKCDIGEGTIGSVKLYYNQNPAKYLALRIIDKSKISQEIELFIHNEIKFFEELSVQKNHCILNLEDYKITIKEYLIGMEYCSGGSISKCLKKYMEKYGKPFSEEIVQYLMRQIVEGVKYIHGKGIIHRDLQNKNIYVKFYNDKDYNELNMMTTHIKIGDFGFSIRENDIKKGVPDYKDKILLNKFNDRSIFKEVDSLDKSSDIWSLGALCFEMLTGKNVFKYKHLCQSYKFNEKNSFPSFFSKEVTSFLNGMLEYNPKKRLTINQLSQHSFLTKDIKQFNRINHDALKENNKIERIDERLGKKGVKYLHLFRFVSCLFPFLLPHSAKRRKRERKTLVTKDFGINAHHLCVVGTKRTAHIFKYIFR